MNFRTPYQSCKDTRARLNAHEINYCDMHLSQLAQNLRYGFFGKMDMVVIEAGDVTDDGEILLVLVWATFLRSLTLPTRL